MRRIVTGWLIALLLLPFLVRPAFAGSSEVGALTAVHSGGSATDASLVQNAGAALQALGEHLP